MVSNLMGEDGLLHGVWCCLAVCRRHRLFIVDANNIESNHPMMPQVYLAAIHAPPELITCHRRRQRPSGARVAEVSRPLAHRGHRIPTASASRWTCPRREAEDACWRDRRWAKAPVFCCIPWFCQCHGMPKGPAQRIWEYVENGGSMMGTHPVRRLPAAECGASTLADEMEEGGLEDMVPGGIRAAPGTGTGEGG